MRRFFPPACLALAALAACSGGGSSSGPSGSDFKVVAINVSNGATWKINRPIDITFNADVDLATVGLNTIRVADDQGGSATGVFALAVRATGEVDPRTVRFRPTCPVEEDFSDAGLLPASFYQLRVLGSKSGGVTVRSTKGEPLEQSKLVSFQTPDSDNPLVLFLDEVVGPPTVRLRGSGGVPLDDETATRLELGGQNVFFELDAVQEGRLPAGFRVPLNHYSIPENRSFVDIAFNQSVDGSAQNLARLRLQYREGDEWLRVATEVTLLENCTEAGATVRLAPRGILPQGRELRVLQAVGFADLTGDALGIEIDNFARMDVAVPGDANPLFPDLDNPEVDEVLETFADQALLDAGAAFEVPPANWGDGRLEASFNFGGTGGPDGDFDWYIPAGTELILDTAGDTIVGGPDGVPTKTQAVVNGVVDVRDVFIPETSRILVVGPNPCTILASGKVTVLGEISVRGSNNPGVGTLNTTNLPEVGAAGQAGGGDGGVGSYLTNQSTPRGGPGEGAFGQNAGGGQGGETCYHKGGGGSARRGAGGGGGTFGPDHTYDHDGLPGTTRVRCQSLVGLDASRGNWGSAEGLGAESGTERAQGGTPGPGPFVDPDPTNDFFGAMLTAEDDLILGELDDVWAGAGGGGGGDAVNSDSFPLIPFDPAGDEKGSGGGGGGGGLRILAIGPIQVGDETTTGSLAVDGGHGGGGENTVGFNRLGGGSGGGSGGHIVLSSAAEIVIYGEAETAEPWYRDDPFSNNHAPRPISATGGQGGTGEVNRGGAKEDGPVPWACCAVPYEYFEGLTDVPPQGTNCYNALPHKDDFEGGPAYGAGGDGGPGIIQFHVDDPATRLRFPTLEAKQGLTYGTGLDVTPACAPPPLGWRELGGPVDSMIPFFGRLSRAQSKWIPLGLARIDATGPDDQVLLRFDGLDDGVPGSDGAVDQLDPILGPEELDAFGTPPYLTGGGYAIVLDPADLAPEDGVYLENPALLRAFTIELSDANDPDTYARFPIASAIVQAGTGWLECTVDATGPALDSFSAAGPVQASLRPHFYRVETDGIADAYPSNSRIRILFDATLDDPLTGEPSEALTYSAQAGELTEDASDLNAAAWDWIRFQVEFDLDVSGSGVDLDTPRPGLQHLRLPFRF